MLFLIILGVLVLIIAFFHYVQGFFSAALSAILAIIAAVLAFSWHEPIAVTIVRDVTDGEDDRLHRSQAKNSPPEMLYASPVIDAASGDASHRISAAHSGADTQRPVGIAASIVRSTSASV